MKRKMKMKRMIPGDPKFILIAILAVAGLLFLLTRLADYARHVKPLMYSEFLARVEKGEVQQVRVADQLVSGIFKDGSRFEAVIANVPANWDILKKNNVAFTVIDTSQYSYWAIALFFALLGIITALIYMLYKQTRGSAGGGGPGNIFSMGKSRARMFKPSEIKETFDSVAGVYEAKEELKDVVDFLKDPEKYKRLGAKMTRGVILVGEPGNGKTLLAKAVAGEANCPFFSISGSDFIEVFVGVGASRVRDLFAQARKHAPSIVFIDEIDAVGRQRGSGLGGGHDEREQTLNQLLAEMDGFETKGGSVMVLAATNRPDVLDKALLRPGRFDRKVEVGFPDLTSRSKILELHAKSVKIDETIDLKKIARGTPGFSGADLANLINEAAIIASKTDRDKIIIADFEEARDKITLGKERKTIILTERDREITAFHEAGHALVRLLIPDQTEPLHKVTIVPRGRALGVTHWLPERDKHTETKKEMVASIMSALGGRIAEEMQFDALTTGAYSDFNVATDIARKMICFYGMSDKLGPVVYDPSKNGSFEYSEKTAELIDQEVLSLLDRCYAQAKELIATHKDKLDILANALLEKETLYSADIYELLGLESREDLRFTRE